MPPSKIASHNPAKEERQRLLIPIVESLHRINSKSDFKLQPKELEAFLQLVESEVLLQVAGERSLRAGLLLTELWLEVDQLDRALTSRNELVKDAKQFFDEKRLNSSPRSTKLGTI